MASIIHFPPSTELQRERAPITNPLLHLAHLQMPPFKQSPSITLLKRTYATNPPTRLPRSNQTKRAPPLSLDHFLQRQRVLSLWRTIIRAINRIPRSSPIRQEMKAFAREEFGRNRAVAELGQIRYLISMGKVEFEKMERYVDEMGR